MDESLAPRQMRNCIPCRRRKIKCDRRIPCGACCLRNAGKDCLAVTDPAIENGGTSSVSAQDFSRLARQVALLQQQVDALQGAVNHSTRSPPSEEPEDETPDTSSSDASLVAGFTARIHPGEDEIAFQLEDFQMAHRVNATRGALEGTIEGEGKPISDTTVIIDEHHPLAFVIPVGRDYIASALQILPAKVTCDRLVEYFFEHVEWFQKTLHRPTFMHQSQQLWSGPSPSADIVCAYLMVVCLALRTIDPTVTQQLNLAPSAALALAERLYKCAEGLLWCSRFLHRQTLESLQVISLMTIYGYDAEDGSDATWALCGAAVKIGQNIGLSQLGPEDQGRTWAPMWRSRLRREIGRRVWWTFVALDWSHAIAHGSTYCVHPSQNHCVLPLNIEDDSLDDDNAVPKPLNIRTAISMQIFKFKFTMLYREITDHMASRSTPSYDFVLAMDEAVLQLMRALPADLRSPMTLATDADPSLVRDAIFINILAEIRILRLHRSFLLRSYRDPTYRKSKERCFRSALTVLRLLELAQEQAPTLLKFWVVLFYAFSAATVISIDLLRDLNEEKRNLLASVLEIFRAQAASSMAARNSAYVLERLLSAMETSERPAKRARVDTVESMESPDDRLRATITEILRSAARRLPGDPQLKVSAPADAPAANETLAVPADDHLFGQDWLEFPLDSLEAFWTGTDVAWSFDSIGVGAPE